MEWLLGPPTWQGLPHALENPNKRHQGKEEGGLRTQQLVDAQDLPLHTPERAGSQEEQLPSEAPLLVTAYRDWPHTCMLRAMHLHLVPVVQDVL